MSSPRTQRPDGSSDDGRPTGAVPLGQPGGVPGDPAASPVRSEPVLAVTGAVAAGLAQLLTDTAGIWVLLDVAGVIAATVAVGMLLRSTAAERGRPALAELATGVVVGGLCVAVLLLARHGPEAPLGALVLGMASVMGGVLTLLIVAGALVRDRREAATVPLTDAALGASGWVTIAAALLTAVAVLTDVVVR
jgi:hypothetical protein